MDLFKDVLFVLGSASIAGFILFFMTLWAARKNNMGTIGGVVAFVMALLVGAAIGILLIVAET